jgi:uncharacterized Zn-finger protein
VFVFPRCDNENKSTAPLVVDVIPVLHSVAEANASDESDGVAKQEDEQIGIFQILDKLEEVVDALLNTSSSLSHSQLETKSKQKPYRYSLSTKSFSCKRDLKIHVRVHTGEKPFSYHHCAKSFSKSSSLRSHLKVHTGEKPNTCHLCTKSFFHSYNLRRHLRVPNGEKQFACSLCTKTFAHCYNLQIHLRVQTGERPYPCPQCTKSFSLSTYLLSFKSSHWEKTLQLLPMFKVICPVISFANTFANSYWRETIYLLKTYKIVL